MKNKTSILLNASRRSLKAGGYAAGFVVTGTEKVRCGFGNGDCLLFDFKHDTFAVADGSERHPRGSRELLERFGEELAEGDGAPVVDELQEYIRKIYKQQKYNSKTTFSCISFVKEQDEIHAAVANGGDSIVLILDMNERKRRFKTAADMNFAGRSITEAAVNLIRIDQDRDRIILATDGFADYIRQVFGAESPEKFGLLYDESPERVVEILTDSLEGLQDKIEYDDIGIIIIDPGKKNLGFPVSILTGGTSSVEENRFSGPGAEEVPDRWLKESDWFENQEIIEKAGIGISWSVCKGKGFSGSKNSD